MITNTNEILCFTKEIDDYIIDFLPGDENLVISFESAGGDFSNKKKNRLGWGKKFFLESPWSVLWIKPESPNWYRGKRLQETLESLSYSGFFCNFKRVILIGGSMGGYAALAYSSLINNAIVIALNPQISLSPHIVPWEKRKFLEKGLNQDWDIESKYVNAASEAKLAKQVYVVYDPYDKNDRMHAEALESENIVHCKIPYIGHNVPVALLQMNCLKSIITDVVNDDFNIVKFRRLVKKRKDLDIYHEKLIVSLFRRKHKAISKKLFDEAISQGRKIRINNYPILKKMFVGV